MRTNPIGYIAWDLDGCLWDSDRLHFDAVNQALAPYTQITEAEHFRTFKGLPTRQKLAMLTALGRLPATAHAKVETCKRQATAEAVTKIIPRPEVSEILALLYTKGWRMACCSNSIRSTVQAVLLNMGLLNYLDFFLSNEDVAEAKPAPEIYFKAARIWQISPGQMIVVEDGEAGKRAAWQAGCQLIEIEGPADVGPWNIQQKLKALSPTRRVGSGSKTLSYQQPV